LTNDSAPKAQNKTPRLHANVIGNQPKKNKSNIIFKIMERNNEGDNSEIYQQVLTNVLLIRGAIIQAFVPIESIMADIVVVLNHEGNYFEYFKSFKPTTKIIEDFLKSYQKFKIHADKYFVDMESFSEDIKYLADIRNRAAHFLWMNDKNALTLTNQNHNIYFFSIRYSNDECCTLNNELVAKFQTKTSIFTSRLMSLQNDVYATLPKFPESKSFENLIDTCNYITLKNEFKSLV
jgi:hypothetical protein